MGAKEVATMVGKTGAEEGRAMVWPPPPPLWPPACLRWRATVGGFVVDPLCWALLLLPTPQAN